MNYPYNHRPKPNASWRWFCVGILIAFLAVVSFGIGLAARARVAEKTRFVSPRPELSASYNSTGRMVDSGNKSGEDIRPLQTMIDALRQVRHFYVEKIEDSQEKDLTYSSLAKMLESLGDPQSRFLVPEQRELADDALNGKFHGIGAALDVGREKTANGMEGRLVVIAALPGSPAEKAGLLPGDIIREKDGKWVISYNPIDRAMTMWKGVRNGQINPAELEKALTAAKKKLDNGVTIQKAADALIKQDTGEIKLVVDRKGQPKSLNMTLNPGVTNVASVEHRVIEGNIGYIRVSYFGKTTADAFAEALVDLRGKKVSRLILDLRNTPGGSSDAALRVAGWLEPGKTFAQLVRARNVRGAITAPNSEKAAKNKITIPAGASAIRAPIVALVNGGTAGAAETLAASLKDNGLATLVGSPTRGNFLQHTMFVLRDGSAVNFTTGKFMTPKGLDLNDKGLKVDVAVAASTTGDAQFDKALATLKAKAGS